MKTTNTQNEVGLDVRKPGLTANAIKLIAIVAMTIDHVTWWLFPGYPTQVLPLLLHSIGRLTCPIMCYFIAEGYHYTRDVNRYTRRLFLFALVSHFAYGFASEGLFIPSYSGGILNRTSVMWALAWGLVMLRVADCEKWKQGTKILLVLLICLIALPSDWSCIASLCVLAFGTNRGNFRGQMCWMVFYVGIYAVVYFFAIDRIYGLLQMMVVLSIPVLKLYNGERGRSVAMNRVMKWFFYLYYPLHLLLIGILKAM